MITDKEFCGSNKLKQMFFELIDANRLPQSILLCGEDGLGRNLFARLIARDYLDDKNGLSLRHVHPDCLEVRGSGASGEISVDSIRAVSYEVHKASIMTDMRRVVVIEDAKNLNAGSSSALLKTLEQPPGGVVFLLTVSSETDVIETIRSRCVTFSITPPSIAASIEYILRLRPEKSEEENIREYCNLLKGRIGYVLKALDSEDFKQTLLIANEFANSCFTGDELLMCSALDKAENRKHLLEILNLSVFCLAKNGISTRMTKAVKVIETSKNMLLRNLSPPLFSAVLISQIV